MDFSRLKVQKKANAVTFQEEKEVAVISPVKNAKGKIAGLDPSLAAYSKAFQTCTTCAKSTCQDLIENKAVCKICGHQEQFLLRM